MSKIRTNILLTYHDGRLGALVQELSNDVRHPELKTHGIYEARASHNTARTLQEPTVDHGAVRVRETCYAAGNPVFALKYLTQLCGEFVVEDRTQMVSWVKNSLRDVWLEGNQDRVRF